MRTVRPVLLVVTLLIGLLGLDSIPSSAAGSWTLVRLSPLALNQFVEVSDVNESGTTVGISGSQATRWDANGSPTALPFTAGCTYSKAMRVNVHGDAAGYQVCNGDYLGTIWPHGGGVNAVAPGVEILGFNDAGGAVGVRPATDADPHDRAALILPGQPVQYLLDTDSGAGAVDLTDTGLVVGTVVVNSPDGPSRSVPVGWYGPYVFPLGHNGAGGGYPLAATNPGWVLLELNLGQAVVGPGDQAYPMSFPGPTNHVEHVRDLNDYGLAVGTRNVGIDPTGTSGELYLGGQAVALMSFAPPSATGFCNVDYPVTISNTAYIAGNCYKPSIYMGWLLRPPS